MPAVSPRGRLRTRLAMIDLHSHLLPGVDDGALDRTDSLAMARVAESDGVELVCATPHIRDDHDVLIDELAARVATLNGELERAGIATRATSGGEVAAPIIDRLSDEDLAALTLGGGGLWILLEPPSGPLDEAIAKAVERLRKRGYRALIAHPERHLGVDFELRLAQLIEAGALIQVTAAYVVEDERDTFLDLAARGLMHVLGSDAHSSHGGRKLAISEGLDRLAGLPHFDWIARDAPAAIVAGESIAPPVAPRPSAR